MIRRELFNPDTGTMMVAGFISGSGSNLKRIIQHQINLDVQYGKSPYRVVVIFSDNPESNAVKIGKEYKIPVVVRDLAGFYRERGKSPRDLDVRSEFDERTVETLKRFNVDVAAYAGYMSIATAPLIKAFLGVNVHPADLSIMEGQKRKYTGDNAVRDAILAGEKQLRASTHIIEPQVDYGRILMTSSPLEVSLPEGFDPKNKEHVKTVSDDHQNRLKGVGDWVIFPKTLEYLADGRYSQDEQGRLYFDDKEIPQGVNL